MGDICDEKKIFVRAKQNFFRKKEIGKESENSIERTYNISLNDTNRVLIVLLTFD